MNIRQEGWPKLRNKWRIEYKELPEREFELLERTQCLARSSIKRIVYNGIWLKMLDILKPPKYSGDVVSMEERARKTLSW